MELNDANVALDAAAAAVHTAATDVLGVVAAQVAQTRPGAALRVTADQYEPFCEVDVVGGGPVTALFDLVDDDTYRAASRAANALYGQLTTGLHAGESRTIAPRP